MPSPRAKEAARLRVLLDGFKAAQAIHVAAELGVADCLGDGARTSEEVAGELGAEPAALYRLMHALAALGVLHEGDGGAFSLTALGALLRADAEPSLRPFARQACRPEQWAAWGQLAHAVRTGENAFRTVHGTSAWAYRERHPDAHAAFTAMVDADAFGFDQAIATSCDFSRDTQIVDVGGGRGSLLAAILAAHPGLRGVLLDRPHAVEAAATLLAARGMTDRCAVVPGDFFSAVPEGGDTYVLKFVLHDWTDEDCIRILVTCRRAMRPGARLIVAERGPGAPNDDVTAALSDLHMLVIQGGRERTTEEMATLLSRAGFAVGATQETGTPLTVLLGIAR
jgi:hypothetical protein